MLTVNSFTKGTRKTYPLALNLVLQLSGYSIVASERIRYTSPEGSLEVYSLEELDCSLPELEPL